MTIIKKFDDEMMVHQSMGLLSDVLGDLKIINYAVVREDSINVFFNSNNQDPFEIRNTIARQIVNSVGETLPMSVIDSKGQYIVRIQSSCNDAQKYLTTLTGYLELSEEQTRRVYDTLEDVSYKDKDPAAVAASVCYTILDNYEINRLFDIFDEESLDKLETD